MPEPLQEIVESTVLQHMAKSSIERVLSEEGRDHDGDPIVRVTIIFDGSKKPLDISETVGVSRHLAEKLSAAGYELFPSLRFVDKSEAGDIQPATA